MPDIISILNYFGITPEKITPLIILAITGAIYLGIKMKPLNNKLRQCCNALIEIQTILKRGGIDLDHKITETSASPLKPTLYGVQLIKESGLEKVLDDNKDFLIGEIKKLLPENYTEYDVQENSRKVLSNLKNNPILNPVKEYVFKNGMDIDIILDTGGLWLRDDFLGQPRQSANE